MKRISFFDNARVILIFLVVFGHLISKYVKDEPFLANIYLFIYTFHMPAFILISGYFAKKINNAGYFEKLVKKHSFPMRFFKFFIVFTTLCFSKMQSALACSFQDGDFGF